MGDSLAKEASLLEAARAALSTDPSRVMALLDEHARTFPRAQLATERNVLRIEALRRLGRIDEARANTRTLPEGEAALYENRVRTLRDAASPR
jgi:hypothetical protein